MKRKYIAKKWNLTDAYIAYVNNEEELKSQYIVPKKAFDDIMDTYIAWLNDCIVLNGRKIRIPYLGFIWVVKRSKNIHSSKKNYRAAIDWQLWKKTGIKAHLPNDHSNGNLFQFTWEKPARGDIFEQFKKYRFKPARYNARLLAATIKGGKTDYLISKKDYKR